MGINLGQTPTKAVYFGQTAVKSVFFGSQRVWGGGSPTPPAPTAEPLCFTLEDSRYPERISLYKDTSNLISIEYSTDGSTWSDYTWDGSTGLQIPLTRNGDKVYFRAKNENQTIGKGAYSCYKFKASGWSGVVRVSGNIQTLLKADGSRTDAPAYCYCNLFYGQPDWKSAPELPATTLADHCYENMFYNCTSLTAAPSLPATTLASNCYNYMFYGCTSLSAAPALPATALIAQCYNSMFYGCTSLTAAPSLPATTLASSCYSNMFRDCTSLTTAPALPATTLADSCYKNMFNGCTSLSSVEVAFTTWGSTETTNWLNNVAASGTFTCPAALPDVRGASNIPTGWQVVNPVEPLCFTAEQANSTVRLDKSGSPAAISLETSTDGSAWTDYSWTGNTGDTVTLANVGDKVYFRAKNENQTIGSAYSNYYQFVMTGKIAASGNIQTLLKADGSRTAAPTYCYRSMFENCTSLTTAPALPATTIADHCCWYMFSGCTSLTAAPALPATTIAEMCYYYMFNGCTSLTTAPATLPAMTLAGNCYASMFAGCRSLAAAPALPATALAGGCYYAMFNGCTSLSSVEVAFTDWTNGATNNWLNNVAASGTFTCPAQLPDARGGSGIPTNWTRVDVA